MPVVAAALVPHSPVIIPTIAGEHAASLASTRKSIHEIAAEFYARQVEVIVILTPHGPQIDSLLTVNAADQYQAELLDFGDRTTRFTVAGAMGLVQRFKEHTEKHDLPLRILTQPQLDYGSVVPISFFVQSAPTLQVIPISVNNAVWSSLTNLGQVLGEFFQRESTRFGLLASADLLPRQKSQTRLLPLERLIGEAVSKVDPGLLLDTSPSSEACGVAPTIALLQTLHRQSRHGQVMSFEAPLGVGLMTASIDVSS